MVWNTQNNFKDNILNIFKLDDFSSELDQDNIMQNSNNSDYCLICYDQLTINKKTKTCTNEKCDAMYHIACICEVIVLFFNQPVYLI